MALPGGVVMTVHDTVFAEDVAAVDRGLDEANDAAGPLRDVRHLSVIARHQGQVIGGAVGRTWGECCELQQLWVSSAHRHQGIGSRLLRDFEAGARERGCRLVYLHTFSFQAPVFYQAHGYGAALEIQGFTHGVVKYTMTKALD